MNLKNKNRIANGVKHLLVVMLSTLLMTQSWAVEKITYYHNDALGSPVAATDKDGKLLWQEAYKPYGDRIRKEDASTNDLWYTGKPHEESFGLSYFGARWYDPKVGRFMAIDPVGFKEGNIQSFNRYAYANNNPYRFIDPDGRENEILNGNITDPQEARDYIEDAGFNDLPRVDLLDFDLEGGIPTSAAGIGTVKALSKGFGKTVAKGVTKVNSKIYNQLTKQLQRDGAKSINKALKSAEKTLKSHKDKLPSLKYKSQVEGTIRNVESQIKTIKQFIKDNKLQ